MHGGNFLRHPGQIHHFHLAEGVELFGVDDRGVLGERNRPAGVTRAAAPRNDGQAEFDEVAHDTGDLFLGIRVDHHKGIFHAPVGGVRHVRDARQAVELDVVRVGAPREQFHRLAAQVVGVAEFLRELVDRLARARKQEGDFFIPVTVHGFGARA